MKDKKIVLIFVLIILYLVSCLGAWYATKWNYTNRWLTTNPNSCDLLIVFTPFLNTIYCLDWIIDKSGIFNINTNEFFSIERR